MDWDSYKRECDSPGVFSRWMLIQTLELLRVPSGAQTDTRFEVREALLSTLAGTPLSKPVDHTGGALTDMFPVALTARQARTVLEIVREGVMTGVTTSGTRERGLGGFAEAWSEYSDSLSDPERDSEQELRSGPDGRNLREER